MSWIEKAAIGGALGMLLGWGIGAAISLLAGKNLWILIFVSMWIFANAGILVALWRDFANDDNR